jgi:signal transduction histidine kinase
MIAISSELVRGIESRAQKSHKGKLFHKISVTDNGVGFETEYAEKIFEVFQRLNNLQDTTGSGIGLAICKKIVQNHKGHIHATGRPDKGATFEVFLPVTTS